MNLPLALEYLISLVRSLPQGSDLFIPLLPILSGLIWLARGLFYPSQN